MRPVLLFVVIGAILLAIGASSFAAATPADRIITVCASGPPTCDHQTIQQAMHAAKDGDTVSVAPGSYQGPVTLKSHILLRASDSQDAPLIFGDTGPLVRFPATPNAGR